MQAKNTVTEILCSTKESEKARQVVRAYYDAFNEKDMDKFFALMSENVIHDVNQGEREIGKERFRKFMNASFEYADEKCYDIMILSNEKGTRAAAEFMCEGTYIKTAPGFPEARNQKYTLPCGAFFELKGGKITRVTTYYNAAEWANMVQ